MAAWQRQLALWIGLTGLAAGGWARAAEPDPAKLAQARSLVAEAVMLDRAQAGGRVTQAYARALDDDLRDGLRKLRGDPALGGVAGDALAALARNDTAHLLALRDRLVALEWSHGRAD